MKPAPVDELRTVLTVRGLSKTFVGQRALDGVDLEFHAGEVHALLGENGSGKSTFIKCLAGFHEPDDGAEIFLDGQPVHLPLTTGQATKLGLVFVHQDLGLIPTLSVAENFAISKGYHTRLFSGIKWRDIRRRASEQLARLGCGYVDVDSPVSRLPIATQTIVAIARALSSAEEGARVLVLDEPTAALPDAESELLFAAVRKVVHQGVAVIYVSHKLEEIIKLADRITVLRDGKKIETVPCRGLDEKDLIRMIVGRDVEIKPREHRVLPGGTAVEVRGIAGNRLRNVSFSIGEGEIVGLAGMLGSGRSELARILFGAQQPSAGTIILDKKEKTFRSPKQALRSRVALIPENRRRDGGVLDLPMNVNLTLPTVTSLLSFGRISATRERATVRGLIDDYRVQPPFETRAFKYFSGGNQQKIVIAKWMNTKPKFVIFDEPVQGVDIGARVEIVEHIRAAASAGTAVLLISSEIDLLLSVCDRLLVLRDGGVIADLPNDNLDRAYISELVYFGNEAVPDAQSEDRSYA